MPWLKLVLALFVVVGCPLNLHAQEASQFVAVKLPRGVQLEVPKGWWFIGEDFNRLIETSVEAAMDLAGEEYASTEEVNLIAANSMPRSTYAAVRIDSTMPPFFTPSDFDTLSEEDVRAYDTQTREQLDEVLGHHGLRIVSFAGSRKELVSGYPALVTEYARNGPKGAVQVLVYSVFTPTQSLSINLSYRQREGVIWRPVLEKIKQSIRIDHAE